MCAHPRQQAGFACAEAGRAIIVKDEPGRITVRTENQGRELLVVSERYHDGWHARVDGRFQPVLAAYGDFLGCVVESGRHEVEFCFNPQSLRLGKRITLCGLGLTLILYLVLRLRQSTPRGMS